MSDLDKLIQRYNPIDKNKWLLEELELEEKKPKSDLSFGETINKARKETYAERKRLEAEELESRFNFLNLDIPKKITDPRQIGVIAAKLIGTIMGTGERIMSAGLIENAEAADQEEYGNMLEFPALEDEVGKKIWGDKYKPRTRFFKPVKHEDKDGFNWKAIVQASYNAGKYKDFYFPDVIKKNYPALVESWPVLTEGHEAWRQLFEDYYKDNPGTTGFGAYFSTHGSIKMVDLVENVLWEMLKSPADIAGLVASVSTLDPINAIGSGLAGAATRSGIYVTSKEIAEAAAKAAARDVAENAVRTVVKNSSDDIANAAIKNISNTLGLADDVIYRTAKSGKKVLSKNGVKTLFHAIDDAPLDELIKLKGVPEKSLEYQQALSRTARKAGIIHLTDEGTEVLEKTVIEVKDRLREPAFRARIIEKSGEAGMDGFIKRSTDQLNLFDEPAEAAKYTEKIIKDLKDSALGDLYQEELATITQQKFLSKIIKDPEKYIAKRGILLKNTITGANEMLLPFEKLDKLKLYKIGEFIAENTPPVLKKAVEVLKRGFVSRRLAPQTLHELAVKYVQRLNSRDKKLIREQLLEMMEEAYVDITDEATDVNMLVYATFADAIDDIYAYRTALKNGDVYSPEIAKKLDLIEGEMRKRLDDYQRSIDAKKIEINDLETEIKRVDHAAETILEGKEQLDQLRQFVRDLEVDEVKLGSNTYTKAQMEKIWDQVYELFDEYKEALDRYANYTKAKKFINENYRFFEGDPIVADTMRKKVKSEMIENATKFTKDFYEANNIPMDKNKFLASVKKEYQKMIERSIEKDIQIALDRTWFRSFDDFYKELRKHNDDINDCIEKAWDWYGKQDSQFGNGQKRIPSNIIDEYIDQGWYSGYYDNIDIETVAKRKAKQTTGVFDYDKLGFEEAEETLGSLQPADQRRGYADVHRINDERIKQSRIFNNQFSAGERKSNLLKLKKLYEDGTMTLQDLRKRVEAQLSPLDRYRIINYYKGKQAVNFDQISIARKTTRPDGTVSYKKLVSPYEFDYMKNLANDIDDIIDYIENPGRYSKYYPGDQYSDFLNKTWNLADPSDKMEFFSQMEKLLKHKGLTPSEIKEIIYKVNKTTFPEIYKANPLYQALPKEAQEAIDGMQAKMSSLDVYEKVIDYFDDPLFVATKEGDEIVWQGDMLQSRNVDSSVTFTSDELMGGKMIPIDQAADMLARQFDLIETKVPLSEIKIKIGNEVTNLDALIKAYKRTNDLWVRTGKIKIKKAEAKRLVAAYGKGIEVNKLKIKNPNGVNYTTNDLQALFYDAAASKAYRTSEDFIPTENMAHWADISYNQYNKYTTQETFKQWDAAKKEWNKTIVSALEKFDSSKEDILKNIERMALHRWWANHPHRPDLTRLNDLVGAEMYTNPAKVTKFVDDAFTKGTVGYQSTGEYMAKGPGATIDFQKVADTFSEPTPIKPNQDNIISRIAANMKDTDSKMAARAKAFNEAKKIVTEGKFNVNELKGIIKENGEVIENILTSIQEGLARSKVLRKQAEEFGDMIPTIYKKGNVISKGAAENIVSVKRQQVLSLEEEIDKIAREQQEYIAKMDKSKAALKGWQTRKIRKAQGKEYKVNIETDIPGEDELVRILNNKGWEMPEQYVPYIKRAIEELTYKEEAFAKRLVVIMDEIDRLGYEFGVSKKFMDEQWAEKMGRAVSPDGEINPWGASIPLYFKDGKVPDHISKAFSESSKFSSRKAWAADLSGYQYAKNGTLGKVAQEINGTPIQYLDKIDKLGLLELDMAKSPVEIGLTTIVQKKLNYSVDAIRNQIFLHNAKRFGLSEAMRAKYIGTILDDVKTNDITKTEARNNFKEIHGFDPYDFQVKAKSDIQVLDGYYFEPGVAEYINQSAQFFKNKNIQKFFNVVNKFTVWWKEMATVMIPGFHMRNAQSNLYNLWLGQGKEAFNPAVHDLANKMLGGDMDGVITVYKGQKYTYGHFMDIADRAGLFDLGEVGGDILAHENFLIRYGKQAKRNKATDWIPVKSGNMWSRKGRSLGLYIENEARLVGFINEMKRHGDPDLAVRFVNKYLFNYRDITAFESSIMKVIFPFYTWTKKNYPLQISQLFQQPGKFALIFKIKRYLEGVEEAPEGWDEYEPDYMKELFGMMTPFENQAGERLVWNPAVAFIDLSFNPFTDPLNMLNPAIKVPIEMATNYQFYTQQPIWDKRYSRLKESPFGYIKGTNEEGENVRYAQVYLDYLIKQIPVLANLGKSIPINSQQMADLPTTLGGILGGVKLMPYDEENSKYFYYKDYVERLRQEIDAMEKKGIWDQEYLDYLEEKEKEEQKVRKAVAKELEEMEDFVFLEYLQEREKQEALKRMNLANSYQ